MSRSIRLPLATALLALSSGGALAQAIGSNSVWIGQVGTENHLFITQDGRDNAAGADAMSLRLGQDGLQNRMTIAQTGYGNRLATWFGNEPRYAHGAWQRGNDNRISVSQSGGTEAEPGNGIGALQQWSSLTPGNGDHNLLTIRQQAGAAGPGQHVVGRVVQIARGGVNSADITQTGGDVAAGNTLANLRQTGAGNSFTLTQDGLRNRLGLAVSATALPIDGLRQTGQAHLANISQSGDDNTISGIWQSGAHNQLKVEIAGDGNTVERIYQDTESWDIAALGNSAVVTIIGAGNGLDAGTAVGGAVPASWSELLQYGDGNNLRLSLLQSVNSRFAITQDGDANEAEVTIGSAIGTDVHRNETVTYQLGDYNAARHEVIGSDNAGAIVQRGDANSATLLQTGDFNHARLSITGDGNGRTALGAAFHGPAASLALGGGLEVGTVQQVSSASAAGAAQRVTLDIEGDSNAFGIRQSGTGNSVSATIAGNGNALAVIQSGIAQHSTSVQQGNRNALAVQQF